MRAVLLAASLSALFGCAQFDPEQDAKAPGDSLGTFAVTGKLVQDDCGAELLGAENPWSFEVKLSRFESDLYWLNGREAIVGEIAADGESFEFGTRIDVLVSSARSGRAGCAIGRSDHAEGKLEFADDDKEAPSVVGFSADLRYAYQAKNGAECVEFLGVPGGVTNLPCELGYRLSATSLGNSAE